MNQYLPIVAIFVSVLGLVFIYFGWILGIRREFTAFALAMEALSLAKNPDLSYN